MFTRRFAYRAAAALALLTGCHGGASPANTQTLQGRFIAANHRRVQMRLEQPGSLSEDLVLPLDPDVKVTVAGKTTTVDQIPSSDRVRMTKNVDTHRVTRIEAD